MVWMMLFLLGISVSTIAFIAAELIARAWVRHQEYFVRKRWERVRLTLDREALPSLEPVVNVEINGEGERGDPLPEDRNGLYRVLVAGGSAVECGLLDQQSAWPAVVQKILNQPDSLRSLGSRRVHVGNIGRSMAPLEAVYATLGRLLPRYEKLDLLILMVGASDATDWLERRTPAQFPQSCLELDDYFKENPGHRFEWNVKGLALKRLAGLVWRRLFHPVRERRNGGRRLLEFRRRRQNARRWVSSVPSPAPMLDHMERYLRLTVEAAKTKGTRVIVVRQPWMDKVLTPEEDAVMWNFPWGRLCLKEEESAYYTHAVVRDVMSKVDRRIERVTSQLGVEQVNLMPVLKADLTNFYDFFHFTPAGARRVAKHTAATVLAPPRVERLEEVAPLHAVV